MVDYTYCADVCNIYIMTALAVYRCKLRGRRFSLLRGLKSSTSSRTFAFLMRFPVTISRSSVGSLVRLFVPFVDAWAAFPLARGPVDAAGTDEAAALVGAHSGAGDVGSLVGVVIPRSVEGALARVVWLMDGISGMVASMFEVGVMTGGIAGMVGLFEAKATPGGVPFTTGIPCVGIALAVAPMFAAADRKEGVGNASDLLLDWNVSGSWSDGAGVAAAWNGYIIGPASSSLSDNGGNPKSNEGSKRLSSSQLMFSSRWSNWGSVPPVSPKGSASPKEFSAAGASMPDESVKFVSLGVMATRGTLEEAVGVSGELVSQSTETEAPSMAVVG